MRARRWSLGWVTPLLSPLALVEHPVAGAAVGSLCVGICVGLSYGIIATSLPLEAFYVFPIGIAAWASSRPWAVAVAIVGISTRGFLDILGDTPLVLGILATLLVAVTTRGMSIYLFETWRVRERVLFLRRCAHELRTPVTLIGGYADMLTLLPPEKQQNAAGIVVEQVDILNDMINKLTDGLTAWDDNDPDYKTVDNTF